MSPEKPPVPPEELAALAAYHDAVRDGTERQQHEALNRLKDLQVARRQLGSQAVRAVRESTPKIQDQPQSAVS